MANAAKKLEPGQYEADLVSNVVSVDQARPHLCTPFGLELNGRGYVAATDGHRLHATACEAWGRYARSDAPPAQHVIPWDAVPIGEFAPAALDDARALCVSVKWEAILELGTPDHKQRVFVSQKLPGKKAGTLHPFGRDGVNVDWFKLDGLRFPLGINLFYLLDAVDFFWPAGNLFVWAAPYTGKSAKTAWRSLCRRASRNGFTAMKNPAAASADTILEITLRMVVHQPRSTTAEALESMRNILVSELGLSRERAVREVRAAMLRRAARSKRPELRRIAARVLAKAWKAPSPDHAELAKFMVDQLKDSIRSDCGDYVPKVEPLLSGQEWKYLQVSRATEELERARKSLAEEENRAHSRSKWLRELRESLRGEV